MSRSQRSAERASLAAKIAPLCSAVRAADLRIGECMAAGDVARAAELRWEILPTRQRLQLLSTMQTNAIADEYDHAVLA